MRNCLQQSCFLRKNIYWTIKSKHGNTKGLGVFIIFSFTVRHYYNAAFPECWIYSLEWRGCLDIVQGNCISAPIETIVFCYWPTCRWITTTFRNVNIWFVVTAWLPHQRAFYNLPRCTLFFLLFLVLTDRRILEYNNQKAT